MFLNVIKENICLSQKTSFKIGGPARYFLEPQNLKELIYSFQFIQKKNLPYFILGGGTNILVSSDPFDGIILSSLKLDKVYYNPEEAKIYAFSGLSNTNLSLFAYSKSIEGFEFMYYLPGSIGGSTFMNARCFGSSFSNVILDVKAIDLHSLNMNNFSNEEINFEYKKSIFQKNSHFIYMITFNAKKGNQKDIYEKMNQNKMIRINKNQFLYPNAGCIFKNNYTIGIPTGQIIEQLNLKNTTIGDAQIYSHHGNFIINKGQATSNEVYMLSKKMRQECKEKLNIDLDYEIQFLGNFI